ncbi:hypothetical protein C8F04DRAFT_1236606 [Mycena alexandri]|uniref:Uncharacterized protein n=1 Tax=Mycena alexandri TaxID=1745969 RepID=A0AAD6SMR5_9AGAR|nr:hypothetical protein C8F04DRAFT_1236606 [Mycena alexandri]
MEPRSQAPKPERVLTPAAEPEITTGTSSATPTTESQLVALLSESRREADSLRRELAAVRKKADADNRRLQALSINSAEHQVHVFQERLARAEAALEEADARSRLVEQHWLQVDRYLSLVQYQAADARRAFSRLMEQDNGGYLVLPDESQRRERRGDIPLRDLSASGIYSNRAPFDPRPPHRGSPSIPESHPPRRSPDYNIRLPPLLPPRRPSTSASAPRSPPAVEEERRYIDAYTSDGSPPHKRPRRGSGSRPQSPRSPSPVPHRRASTSAPRPHEHLRARPPEPMHHHHRAMPPPSLLPAPRQDAHHRPIVPRGQPPLQFIQHAPPRPPTPPRLPTPPPRPPTPPRTGFADASAPQHQYQHRFHLSSTPYNHGARRVVRPGAYETVVFALDSDASSVAPAREVDEEPPVGGGRAKAAGRR